MNPESIAFSFQVVFKYQFHRNGSRGKRNNNSTVAGKMEP